MAYFFFHDLAFTLNNQGGSKPWKNPAKGQKSKPEPTRRLSLRLRTNLSRSISSLSSASTTDTSFSSPASARQSAMRHLSVSTIEYFRTQAGTPESEIDSFLAGGRENPNPYLHEVQLIAALDLGLMTIAQIKRL